MSKIKIFISLVIIILFIGCNSTKKYDEQTKHLDRITYKLTLSDIGKAALITLFENKTYTVRSLKKIKLKGKWKHIDSTRIVFYEVNGKNIFDTITYNREEIKYRGIFFKRYDTLSFNKKEMKDSFLRVLN